MKASRIQGAKGPIPAPQLTPVLSIRDIDGHDIHRGLYLNSAGEYVLARCRDGVPNAPVGETVNLRTAFRVYGELLAKIRPGMDVHRDGESKLMRDMQDEVPDPEGAGETMIPCVLVGWGSLAGRGVFLDAPGGDFFRGAKGEDGAIHHLERIPMFDALQMASEIIEWTGDADIEGLSELLKTASERIRKLEKRAEVEELVAGAR